MSKWRQLELTAANGTISLGMGTRLMSPAFSTSDVVPEVQPMLKKLNGTNPHITKAGKCGIELFRVTFVKTKVNTPISTSGFNTDQNTPKDMFL
jgi:hypothetical protein